MKTLLVTGSDTGIGKTNVTAALVRLLGQRQRGRIQIVKVVETGRSETDAASGDAHRARVLSGVSADAFTLACFPAALSPPAAAAAVGAALSLELLVSKLQSLPPCDWRILEGAGGIATPVDDRNRDWVDLAVAARVDAIVVVVPHRLGAINQARLAFRWAGPANIRAGIWLNACAPVDAEVAAANCSGLAAAGIPVWAVQPHGASLPLDPQGAWAEIAADNEQPASAEPGRGGPTRSRWKEFLAERDRDNLRRRLRPTSFAEGALNLADNDYLALARDSAVVEAVRAAASRDGTSASASPLITGWRDGHARLIEELARWHGFPWGLCWTSGYAANSAVLGTLPQRGDLVLADRLIHHSMVAGILRSGATLRRYAHRDLGQLEELLVQARRAGRSTFVATETVFSMEGDFPDLVGMAKLKCEYGFFWIVDEAHGLGWYGPEGAGMVREQGVETEVDVLVGTLGKTLASGGAYTLFRDEVVRDFLVNSAGEFIYSTALPPTNAAAALAALARVRALANEQSVWKAMSRTFRTQLQESRWEAPNGESPIVPVRLDDPDAALSLVEHLRCAGILAAAVRPPTVPAGTSRLRFSLKRTFDAADARRVVASMNEWRTAR